MLFTFYISPPLSPASFLKKCFPSWVPTQSISIHHSQPKELSCSNLFGGYPPLLHMDLRNNTWSCYCYTIMAPFVQSTLRLPHSLLSTISSSPIDYCDHEKCCTDLLRHRSHSGTRCCARCIWFQLDFLLSVDYYFVILTSYPRWIVPLYLNCEKGFPLFLVFRPHHQRTCTEYIITFLKTTCLNKACEF